MIKADPSAQTDHLAGGKTETCTDELLVQVFRRLDALEEQIASLRDSLAAARQAANPSGRRY